MKAGTMLGKEQILAEAKGMQERGYDFIILIPPDRNRWADAEAMYMLAAGMPVFLANVKSEIGEYIDASEIEETKGSIGGILEWNNLMGYLAYMELDDFIRGIE